MLRRIAVILPSFLCLLFAFSVRADVLVGKVTRVSDGDTIWVEARNKGDTVNRKVKVRLDRIDAPESKQLFGRESTAFLKQLIFGKDVEISYEKKDRYGRVLGIVRLHDGDAIVDVNLMMVANGMAWHYAHFDRTPAYMAAQRRAQEAKVGLWANDAAENPYEWRKRRRKM